MSPEFDFRVDRGTDWSRRIRRIVRDTREAIDLTGHRAEFLMLVPEGEEVILKATTESQHIAIDGPAGAYHVSLSKEDTDREPRRYIYYLDDIDPANVRKRVLHGHIEFIGYDLTP
jgi:hypothetical protein